MPPPWTCRAPDPEMLPEKVVPAVEALVLRVQPLVWMSDPAAPDRVPISSEACRSRIAAASMVTALESPMPLPPDTCSVPAAMWVAPL